MGASRWGRPEGAAPPIAAATAAPPHPVPEYRAVGSRRVQLATSVRTRNSACRAVFAAHLRPVERTFASGDGCCPSDMGRKAVLRSSAAACGPPYTAIWAGLAGHGFGLPWLSSLPDDGQMWPGWRGRRWRSTGRPLAALGVGRAKGAPRSPRTAAAAAPPGPADTPSAVSALPGDRDTPKGTRPTAVMRQARGRARDRRHPQRRTAGQPPASQPAGTDRKVTLSPSRTAAVSAPP